MQEIPDQEAQIDHLLDRLRQGDDSVRAELIAYSQDQLSRRAHNMLKGDRVRRWVETDDLLQNALLRLHKTLAEVKPNSAGHFFALAARETHRELTDLARHYFDPEGIGANHFTDKVSSDSNAQPKYEVGQTTHNPEKLYDWGLFHEKVGTLPAKEKRVFELHWYEGLTLVAIAKMLEVSTETAERAWRSASKMLRKLMQGDLPGS